MASITFNSDKRTMTLRNGKTIIVSKYGWFQTPGQITNLGPFSELEVEEAWKMHDRIFHDE